MTINFNTGIKYYNVSIVEFNQLENSDVHKEYRLFSVIQVHLEFTEGKVAGSPRGRASLFHKGALGFLCFTFQ